MLRFLLLVMPAMVIIASVGFGLLIPVTWILDDVRPMYAVARAAVKFIVRLAGVRVERSGVDPWKAPLPCLFVANHVSNVDPPAIFPYLPRVAILAKASIFRWPLLGYGLKMGGFIPVERNQPESRRRALEAGIAQLRSGLSLLIFPEGTRSPDGRLLPFRRGPFLMAIETQRPIVPVTILGTREIMPRGRLAIRPGRARFIFHQPIPTAGLSASDRDGLIEKVRQAIASALPE